MTPFDQALHDYYYHEDETEFVLHNDYGDPEDMPVEVLFRLVPTELEEYALTWCKGHVLDIGAGVGVHSLFLQHVEQRVTALEVSSKACQIMADRGVVNILNQSMYAPLPQKYDTLLMLMNGLGLCGTIANVPHFFNTLKAMLNPGGYVVADSSDVAYMFEELPAERYYGEVRFCYEYKHLIGEWFDWLYIDPEYLQKLARENGWSCEVVFDDGYDQYLALLKPDNYD